MITAHTGYERQRRTATIAFILSGLSLGALWARSRRAGGTAALAEIEAYLHGLLVLPAAERDCLAQALNGHLHERNCSYRATYSGNSRT